LFASNVFSTGGIIALALGVKNWSVDDCIKRFVKLCDQAFTPRELHKIPVIKKVAAFSHGSTYKTKPLYAALQEEFGNDILFGGRQQADSKNFTKVAVTSTDEVGQKAIIFANYRHFRRDGPSCEYYRPSNPELEMRIWEAAAATSAAPSYFKPFYHEVTGRSYLDGALYNNNPVRVAHKEITILWPDVSSKAPDIFLSIGTGQNKNGIKNEMAVASECVYYTVLNFGG
jgi:patatin-like phospholipase/acyl hydrolase